MPLYAAHSRGGAIGLCEPPCKGYSILSCAFPASCSQLIGPKFLNPQQTCKSGSMRKGFRNALEQTAPLTALYSQLATLWAIRSTCTSRWRFEFRKRRNNPVSILASYRRGM